MSHFASSTSEWRWVGFRWIGEDDAEAASPDFNAKCELSFCFINLLFFDALSYLRYLAIANEQVYFGSLQPSYSNPQACATPRCTSEFDSRVTGRSVISVGAPRLSPRYWHPFRHHMVFCHRSCRLNCIIFLAFSLSARFLNFLLILPIQVDFGNHLTIALLGFFRGFMSIASRPPQFTNVCFNSSCRSEERSFDYACLAQRGSGLAHSMERAS